MGFFSKLRSIFSGRGAGEAPKASNGFFSKERWEERKRQREYERSQRRMEKWERQEKKRQEKEKARREEQERIKKEADHRKRVEQFKQSFRVFNERYGETSAADFVNLIDTWGGVTQDMKDIFGDSKRDDGSMIYAYKALKPEHQKHFPSILKHVMNEIEGQGYNQEQAINKLYDTIDYLNAGGEL